MVAPKQSRRRLPLRAVGLFALLITGLTIAGMVRYWHFRQRVRDTVTELRETLSALRSSRLGLDDAVLDQFERDVDGLQAHHMPKMGRPVPLLAYLGPASDTQPDDPPILTLHWLEAGQVTDGVVLEVVGKTNGPEPVEIARVTGWAVALSDAEMQQRHKGRFDRHIFVDVQIDGGERAHSNRDVVEVTREQLGSSLTARLIYDETTTDAMPVHVAKRLLKECSAESAP